MEKVEKNWYFNQVSEEPEYGKLSPSEVRMGPYESREAALKAWKIVKQRNKKWEDDEKRWQKTWGGKVQEDPADSDNDETPTDSNDSSKQV